MFQLIEIHTYNYFRTAVKFEINSDSDDNHDVSLDDMSSDADGDSEEVSSYKVEDVKSPYDALTYKSICVSDTLEADMNLIIDKYGLQDYVVKQRPPWHVQQNCTFIIQITSLKSPKDITIDCWNWYQSKTYVLSSEAMAGPFQKGNEPSKFRSVKRIYKMKDNENLEKSITAMYAPHGSSTDRSNPFKDCEPLVVIRYRFVKGKQVIEPSKTTRVYPSIKQRQVKNMEKGFCAKKATYVTETEVGGIESAANKSCLPKRRHGHYAVAAKKKREAGDDPLKELIQKQHNDGAVGDSIIRKIQTNEKTYDIVLFNDRQIQNIANYCCTDQQPFKSTLDFDFTFELGKKPSYYVLVTTYRNTSLFVKGKEVCPTMLGPVMICHRKDERVVKFLCDAMKEKMPGIEDGLKVIGMDGGKSIVNMACWSFPRALLLLCMKHAQDNCSANMAGLSSDAKAAILTDIFGKKGTEALVDAVTFEDFTESVKGLYVSWEEKFGDEGKKFAEYFRKYKEDKFKFHLIRGVVQAAEIAGDPSRFYSNCPESMNKLLKLWQGKQKLDLYQFARSYEEIIQAQENDVMRAFLRFPDAQYTVRPAFQSNCMDFTREYSMLPIDAKRTMKAKVLNVLVDPAAYKETTAFKCGKHAVHNARKNVTKRCHLLNSFNLYFYFIS